MFLYVLFCIFIRASPLADADYVIYLARLLVVAVGAAVILTYDLAVEVRVSGVAAVEIVGAYAAEFFVESRQVAEREAVRLDALAIVIDVDSAVAHDEAVVTGLVVADGGARVLTAMSRFVPNDSSA